MAFYVASVFSQTLVAVTCCMQVFRGALSNMFNPDAQVCTALSLTNVPGFI